MYKITCALMVVLALAFPIAVPTKAGSTAQKAADACRWQTWDYSKITFSRGNERLTYELSTKNKTWDIKSFGWHATGILTCKDCIDGTPAGGMYHFTGDYASSQHKPGKKVIPQTAKQRIGRAYETFGYPIIGVDERSLTPLSSRENIRFHQFNGYGVLFEVKATDELKKLTGRPAFRGGHLLILSLTDGCLAFETTIELNKRPKAGIDLIDSILEDISFSLKRMHIPAKPRKVRKYIPPSDLSGCWYCRID